MALADVPSTATPDPKGGASFLIERHAADAIQIPERFDDELRMFAQTADAFVEREILPDLEALEALDYDLSREKMRAAGAAGVLGVEVPEAYGGLEHTKTAACLVAERMARSGSFNVTFNAHASIGTLPIVYFGTDAQKERYLPGLVAGELVGAYCLSEPESGSDSLSARTRATLEADGTHYRLDGTKMWISNAGFADLFTVFAKVDGEHFTAFLVERDTPGLSLGAEEKKMGIKGSSTRQVVLEDARVPVENVLGEVGKGHRIALGVLNIGRLKLAAGSIGGSKEALKTSVAYALERKQFGQPIANFGLIQQKIGAMAAETFAVESALYRLCGEVDARLADVDDRVAELKALNEYVVEYSLLKIHASEILDRSLDEAIQIHGGYGYSAEYGVERAYRDSRVNRIFEGTNEINRLLSIDQLFRRAMRGDLALLGPAQAAIEGDPVDAVDAPAELADAVRAVENLKQATLLVAGLGAQAFGTELEEEQEVVARASDMIALVYLAESALLRAEALLGTRDGAPTTLARLFAFDAVARARTLGVEALQRIPEGTSAVAKLDAYLAPGEIDRIALRRSAAAACYAAGGLPV